MAETIKIANLVTGEVVIGAMEEGSTVMKAPHCLLIRQTTPTNLDVRPVPYGSLFGVLPPVEVLEIRDHMVMFPLREAPEDLAKFYKETTSGIALPQTGGLHLVKG